ncbi:MAG TPA: PH domain-containing protein [Acidimicrobiales bacterium]|jgi:uncharacterized membrane protein YdbT with pleckstrin-like domain|nr:PH domain-containing protein [Acidimicrobiales bacterium]
MPYPQELLNSHEKIVVDNHPHWLYFLEPALAGLGTLLLLAIVAFRTSGDARNVLVTILLLVAVGLALWALVRLINWRAVDFVITTDRVIYRSGVFAKRGVEIPLPRVNNVNFSQGILERLLGAGNLMIESGGEEGQSHFTDIREPQHVQRIIHEQIEAYRNRRWDDDDGRPGPAASPPPPPPPRTDLPVSVADEIAKLEELVQRGTITPAQFEAQKQRLLGG